MPELINPDLVQLLKQAVELELIRTPHICNRSLILPAKQICGPCVLDYIKDKPQISVNNFGQLFNLTPKEVMQLFNTLMYDQRMAMGKIANGFYQRSPEIPFLEETTEPAMESAEISPNIQSEVEPNTEVPIEEFP